MDKVPEGTVGGCVRLRIVRWVGGGGGGCREVGDDYGISELER